VAQILKQLDRRHTTFNGTGGAIAPRSADATKWQVFTETQCDLRLDAEPAIISGRKLSAAMVHLLLEDRSINGFVDAAQLLHDRRR
jgi:hypothetical protein